MLSSMKPPIHLLQTARAPPLPPSPSSKPPTLLKTYPSPPNTKGPSLSSKTLLQTSLKSPIYISTPNSKSFSSLQSPHSKPPILIQTSRVPPFPPKPPLPHKAFHLSTPSWLPPFLTPSLHHLYHQEGEVSGHVRCWGRECAPNLHTHKFFRPYIYQPAWSPLWNSGISVSPFLIQEIYPIIFPFIGRHTLINSYYSDSKWLI